MLNFLLLYTVTINNICYQVRNVKRSGVRGEAINAAGLWLAIDAGKLSLLSSHKMQMEVQARYLVESALGVDCSEGEPMREGQQQERLFGGY